MVQPSVLESVVQVHVDDLKHGLRVDNDEDLCTVVKNRGCIYTYRRGVSRMLDECGETDARRTLMRGVDRRLVVVSEFGQVR